MFPWSARTSARSLRLLVTSGLLGLLGLAAGATASASTSSSTYDPDMFGFSVGGDIQYQKAGDRGAEFDLIKDIGGRWVRFDIHWSAIQAGGPNSYNWGAHDAAIQDARTRGLKVLAMIGYTPEWARSGDSDKYPPDDPADYASFAAKVVERYSAMGVHHYEVWNEPNLHIFWKPAPDRAAYTELLKAAYPAIKAANPEATVLTAGTAPASSNGTNYSAVDFLAGIYANGGAGSFDAVSHHPYTYTAHGYPGDVDHKNGWYQMYGTSPSLRSLMVANGDGDKKIWGTEFGAPTSGADSVSEADQAEMITQAYSLWRTYSWAGPLFSYEARDHGTDTSEREDFFGLTRHDLSKKPAYDAYRAVASGEFDDSVLASTSDADADDDPPDTSGDATSGADDAGGGGGAAAVGSQTGNNDLQIAPEPLSTFVKVRGRGGRKAKRRKVRGRVIFGAPRSKAPRARERGTVKLALQRRFRTGWRRIGMLRTTKLNRRGVFRRRLGSFRRRPLRPGRYRVRARYVGSRQTQPSAARSPRFRLRPRR